jgi:hypothetical protein
MQGLGYVLVGVIIFFTIILLTIVLGAVGRREGVRRKAETGVDIATGRDRDVTVNPRANDPWVRSPDDRLPLT